MTLPKLILALIQEADIYELEQFGRLNDGKDELSRCTAVIQHRCTSIPTTPHRHLCVPNMLLSRDKKDSSTVAQCQLSALVPIDVATVGAAKYAVRSRLGRPCQLRRARGVSPLWQGVDGLVTYLGT